MKRMIMAIFLIIFALFISVYGFFDIKKTCNEIIDSLENTISACESHNDDDRQVHIDESLEKWEKSQLKFGIYCNHDSLDSLDMNFRTLADCKNKKTDCDIESVCLENIRYLEKIIESEAPRLKNVF